MKPLPALPRPIAVLALMLALTACGEPRPGLEPVAAPLPPADAMPDVARPDDSLSALLGPGMDACIAAAARGTQPADTAFHDAGFTGSSLVGTRTYSKSLDGGVPGARAGKYVSFGFRRGKALCEITLVGAAPDSSPGAWLGAELAARGYTEAGRTDRARLYANGKRTLAVTSGVTGDMVAMTLRRAV